MHMRNLHSVLVNHLRPSLFFVLLCPVLLLALMFPDSSTAEYYKYTDKDGVIHFTDNLADIPKEQRTQIETLQVPKGSFPAGDKPRQKAGAKETSGRPVANHGPESQVRNSPVLEELKARKAALDMERSQLEQELAAVIQRGEAQRVTRAIWRVNADLEALTERLIAHWKQREEFEKERDKYYSWLNDSPELRSLKERKAILDKERSQLQEKLTELTEKHRGQLNQRREIRWYKIDLHEINEQFHAYQQKREAFEKDWAAFYAWQ